MAQDECPKCGNKKDRRAKACRSCNVKPESRQMTEAETAWVAGILEGEACWSHHTKARQRMRIVVVMTDEDIIQRLAEVTGAGNVRPVTKQEDHWKQAWSWSVTAKNEVASINRQVLPWLGERRKAKIVELST